jgi:hypothetical protein
MPATVGHRMLSRLLVNLSLIYIYKLINVGPPVTHGSRHVFVRIPITYINNYFKKKNKDITTKYRYTRILNQAMPNLVTTCEVTGTCRGKPVRHVTGTTTVLQLHQQLIIILILYI